MGCRDPSAARAVFAPLAAAVIECASAGVCSSDFSLFDYRKLRRPIYPLDENFANGRTAAAAA